MFEAFFGFVGTPFGRDVPVNQLLETDMRKELAGRLQHVARTRSFGVFTGDAGTGKTTAIRKFTKELDQNRHRVLYLSDSVLTPRNFYWEALHQLGCTPRFYRGDAKRQLHKALVEMTESERKNPVVIVDEAHLLSREMLEEIRFLLNWHMDSHSALALILIGQSELKETLKLQVNQAISQRIDIRFHLHPLESAETIAYVTRHLEAAKTAGEIFTPAAITVMHEYTGGIPRKINKVATACLMAAVSRKQRLVDDHLMRVVIESEFEA
jgi:type II secretory pathway predicted ATPase ExeA